MLESEIHPIELNTWPLPKDDRTQYLLQKAALSPEEKEELLQKFEDRFEEQKRAYGYQARDLIVLHPDVPNLDQLLSQFDKIHTHDDDEVRYIVDGSGYFGFLFPDGHQKLIKVEAGQYIRVPAHTKHWFLLDDNKRIKAVRYFTSQEGWVAKYTGDQIQI